MKKMTKVSSIYTIIYSVLSFILILAFFFLTIASRGFILITPFILLPFLTGFLYLIALVLNIICCIKNKMQNRLYILFVLNIFFFIVEMFALLVPFFAYLFTKDGAIVMKILVLSFLSVPITKISILIVSIIILVSLRKYHKA